MNYWTDKTYKQLVLRLDTLPQAILIHGPRGLGKLELARSFAQRILCEGRDPGTQACGRCEGCRWFLAGQHPDYRQIEPEAIAPVVESDEEGDRPATAQKKKPSTEIKIEQVRELTDFLNIGSHRARRRIALFHPAEAINRNAANALLKSLEEPAPGACFVLVSHQPRLLLPTIRSRCVAFAVHAPDVATGVRWLEEQGIVSPAQWLALAAGAPLAAKDLATSDAGKRIAGLAGAARSAPGRSRGAPGDQRSRATRTARRVAAKMGVRSGRAGRRVAGKIRARCRTESSRRCPISSVRSLAEICT